MRDLAVKAKQIDYLIQSLPEPESEEVQVRVEPPRYHHAVLKSNHTGGAFRGSRRGDGGS